MDSVTIKRARKLKGMITVPGDKSISHRAGLLSLLCREPLDIHNYSDGVDCATTLSAIEGLGARVEGNGSAIHIVPPRAGMLEPEDPIDCGNSGTTVRLLSGILAGAGIKARLVGDESLSRRPMKRIIDPLRQMNCVIEAGEEGRLPITVGPGRPVPIDYILPVASAQVKSAILLAGLASGTEVVVREKAITRDHTERMISYLGGGVRTENVEVEIIPDPDDPRKKKKVIATESYKRSVYLDSGSVLKGGHIEVPGDLSTAAYFIAAALIVPGSHVIITGVGVNPTRMAFVTLLKQMGAEIHIKNRQEVCGEPIGDIEVSYSSLKPRRVAGDIIPNLIDELPVLAVMAALVPGTTIVRDAAELRHKETDRISAVVKNLTDMGVKVGEFPDGFAIEGGEEINGAEIDSFGDHRIAMAFAVAGLAAHGRTIINGSGAASISCPPFYTILEGLRA